MPTNFVADQAVKRSSKQYGETTVSDNARVHLGDVLQGVNVNGDLHLHYHRELNDFTGPSAVIEFLDLCQELISHHDLVQHDLAQLREYSYFQARTLNTLLERLARLRSQLSHEHACIPRGADKGHGQEELRQTLVAVLADAAHISRSLDSFRTVVRIETFSIHDEDGLDKLRTSFLAAWKTSDLTTRLESCFSYRARVSRYFHLALNAEGTGPEDGSARNNFVEVLAMHRGIQANLQPLGAVLTREDGQSTMLTLPSFRNSQHDASDMALIKYDLTTKTGDARTDRRPLVNSVTNFVHLIRSRLSFREESYRLIEVKEAHRKTFQWIFNTPNTDSTSKFRIWLEGDERLFWVSGKAGSGKSTLMKFIQEHPLLQRHLKKWIAGRQLVTGNFFFWAAGKPLQKSHEGILRSLLHQILEARPDLTAVIFPDLSRHLLHEYVRTNDLDAQLSMQELYAAVKLLLKAVPDDLAIFLLIDGIDEFLGDHFEFSRFILELITCPSIKVLVSSRPIPACTQIFSSFPSLRLQDLTAPDIRAYIESELLQNQLLLDMDALEPGLSSEIERELVSKASGVFLWIYLVVNSLLRGLAEYDDRDVLMQKIDALPSDLERLYDHMFAKMSPEHRREGSVLLRLTICAKETQSGDLSALQLFAATRHHQTKTACCVSTAYEPQHDELRVKTIDGKIRSRCCGLIEVRYSDGSGLRALPWVDFLHRTVRDYLLEPLISERVEKDSNISKNEIDLLLLVSATHLLKKSPASFSSGQRVDWFAELFEACLQHAYSLSSVKDDQYIHFLDHAIAFLNNQTTHYCSNTYHKAFNMFRSKRPDHVSQVPKVIPFYIEVDPSVTPTKAFAAYGFPSYFAHKLRTCVIDSETKACLLLGMLVLRKTHDLPEALLLTYTQNMECLLSIGTDPNDDATGFHRDHASLRQACISVDRCRSSKLSPWDFWISQPHVTFGDLYTSIRLLKISTPTDMGSEVRRALVSQFHRTLRYYQGIGIWPEDPQQACSTQPLPSLDLGPEPELENGKEKEDAKGEAEGKDRAKKKKKKRKR